MAGLNLQLSPLTFPAGQEFPGTIQELENLFCQYTLITGSADFTGVAYGSTEPSEDERDLWWARTDGSGNPLGWYAWDGAAWAALPITVRSGPTSSRPSSPPTGTLYLDTDINVELIYERGQWRTASGSPGDIKYVTAATLADALTANPGWDHFILGIGNVIQGALADGSDQGDTIGSSEITISEDQMPAHTHEDIHLTGSEADNGDAGTFAITASTQSVGVETMAASGTGSKGGGQPISVVQPTIIMFALYKL